MNYEPGFALILIDITSQDSEQKKLKTWTKKDWDCFPGCPLHQWCLGKCASGGPATSWAGFSAYLSTGLKYFESSKKWAIHDICVLYLILYIRIIITLQVVLRNWKTEVNIVTCLEDLISFLPISWSVIGPRCDIASGLNYLHAEVWGADRVLATCSWFCHIMWPMLAIDSRAHPKLFRDLNSGRGIIIIFPAIAI